MTSERRRRPGLTAASTAFKRDSSIRTDIVLAMRYKHKLRYDLSISKYEDKDAGLLLGEIPDSLVIQLTIAAPSAANGVPIRYPFLWAFQREGQAAGVKRVSSRNRLWLSRSLAKRWSVASGPPAMNCPEGFPVVANPSSRKPCRIVDWSANKR